MRFHEGLSAPRPCYGEEVLRSWAAQIAGLWSADEQVFVFFNNDTRSCALRDAAIFAGLCRDAGLKPTKATAKVSAG